MCSTSVSSIQYGDRMNDALAVRLVYDKLLSSVSRAPLQFCRHRRYVSRKNTQLSVKIKAQNIFNVCVWKMARPASKTLPLLGIEEKNDKEECDGG